MVISQNISKVIDFYLKYFYVPRIEIFLGFFCALNKNCFYICVSNSMKKWISKKFRANDERVRVLYDRPCEKYCILSEKERQKVIYLVEI